MSTYTFTPNPPNPSKVNELLGSSKVVEILTQYPFSKVVLVTSEPFTAAELDAIRARLDKIFIFGYSETVVA